MKKFKKIGLALLCIAFTWCLGYQFFCLYAHASWASIQVEEEYEIGSVFQVPEREVVIKGKSKKATAVVMRPDGEATKRDKVTLDTAGMYTVVYTAIEDGKSYVDEVSFKVHNNLYSFNREESSATYGKHELAKSKEGLLVRLAEGDKLTLNEIVDIDSLGESDSLVSCFITPDIAGEIEFGRLCFEFADINNPDITLYVSIHPLNWSQDFLRRATVYFQAGINGEPAKGKYQYLEDRVDAEADGAEIGYEGHQSWSLYSEKETLYADEQEMSFRMDPETMIVYAGRGYVIDLDDTEYFNSLWEGFPSGKAYCTIWADAYYGQSANFCLTKIGNVDLSAKKVIDAEAPVISVDTTYETMPPAVKGGTYEVPTAKAMDLYSGECDVTVSAWYNFHSPNASVLDIIDGKFNTSRMGQYAIVYEATDAAGNVGKEILWVKAETSLEKPTIALKKTPEYFGTVGYMFKPLEYTYECHSGEPKINIYAKLGKKVFDMKKGFIPEKEGVYTIVYEIIDCAGQVGTYEYDVTMKMSDSPVLVDEILLPKYFVEGAEYVFPTIYFNDYRSGKLERKIATGKLIDAAGEKKLAAGDTWSPTVDATTDAIKLVFTCENATHEVSVPTVKAWGKEDGRSIFCLENYFVGSGFTVENDSGAIFQATATDGGWIFANRQIAKKFSLELRGVPEKTDFKSLVLTMQDYEDEAKKLTVELLNTEGALSVKVGENTRVLKKGTDFASGKSLRIQYEGNVLTVGGVEINIGDFGGFPSNYLYLSANFKNAGKNAAFTMLSLNGHNVNVFDEDRVGAQIVLFDDYGGMKQYGSKITLPAAMAGDVLNPTTEFTMTVLCDSKVVKDIDGLELKDVNPMKEYTIKADVYGRYEVKYTAIEDFSEKKSEFSYILHVIDEENPTVEFSQEFQTKAKVGDTLCIPDFVVSDNITEEKDLVIGKYVSAPNGVFCTIPEKSNSVKATIAGEYEFMVIVVDEEGNLRNVTWTVEVAETK